jgi:hypothetical protein
LLELTGDIKEMDKLIALNTDIKIQKSTNDYVIVELGSGEYRFVSPYSKKP